MNKQFQIVCSAIVASNLYDSGASIKEIAEQAKKSPATIRRWIRIRHQIPDGVPIPNRKPL